MGMAEYVVSINGGCENCAIAVVDGAATRLNVNGDLTRRITIEVRLSIDNHQAEKTNGQNQSEDAKRHKEDCQSAFNTSISICMPRPPRWGRTGGRWR